MNYRNLMAVLICMLLAAALSPAQTATCNNWTTFTLPSPWIRTLPNGINQYATVVGYTYDPGQNTEGFIHYPDGSFKLYRAPNSAGTQLSRRNTQGVSVGTYWDTTSAHHKHGIVVYSSSSATVNYPAASDTYATGINKWGSIVGFYLDSSRNYQGYELKNGKYTRIHYPGSVWTTVSSINDSGVIVGTYATGVSGTASHGHGFVLQNGVFKTINDPKGTGGGTYLNDINNSGTIVGVYFPNENPQGFININGIFKDIKAPNSSGTTVSGINGYGYVTGEATISGSTGYTAHCQ
jgi:hypothetical protein